jgi:hypothetical protein
VDAAAIDDFSEDFARSKQTPDECFRPITRFGCVKGVQHELVAYSGESPQGAMNNVQDSSIIMTNAPLSQEEVEEIRDLLGSHHAEDAHSAALLYTQKPTLAPETKQPTFAPTAAATPAPSTLPPALQRTPCPNDCSGQGTCLLGSLCQCKGGWTGFDCSLFVFTASLLGNTSELEDSPKGSIARLTIRVAKEAPNATATCRISCTPSDEARTELTEIKFYPNVTEKSIKVLGVLDFVDDGPQPFDVQIGPCSSSDPRFDFSWKSPKSPAIASGWNEDYPYAAVSTVQPEISSMIGQMVTLQGRHLQRVTSVCVEGVEVSQSPEFRVSISMPGVTGAIVQNEIELTSSHFEAWFNRVTGKPYRPPNFSGSKACSALLSGSFTGRRRAPTASNSSVGSPNASMPVLNYGSVNSSSPTPKPNRTVIIRAEGSFKYGNLEFTYKKLQRISTQPLLGQVAHLHAR